MKTLLTSLLFVVAVVCVVYSGELTPENVMPVTLPRVDAPVETESVEPRFVEHKVVVAQGLTIAEGLVDLPSVLEQLMFHEPGEEGWERMLNYSPNTRIDSWTQAVTAVEKKNGQVEVTVRSMPVFVNCQVGIPVAQMEEVFRVRSNGKLQRIKRTPPPKNHGMIWY